jgi:hypothetical protein
MKGFAADLDVHGEVGADVERWVDVDEFETASILDLAAEGAGFKGGEDELIVAPNEFIGPALELATGGVHQLILGGGLLAGFVDVFEGLKREDGGADVAGLAGPSEFDLTFVVEEEEAVFLGEWFAGLDELDEVALLLIGEFVAFGRRRAGHDWAGGAGRLRGKFKLKKGRE